VNRKTNSSSLSRGFYPFGGWGPTGFTITKNKKEQKNKKQKGQNKEKENAKSKQNKTPTAKYLLS
jgi:hypothetical protein